MINKYRRKRMSIFLRFYKKIKYARWIGDLNVMDFDKLWIRIFPKNFCFKITKTDDYKTLNINLFLIGITYWFYRAI